MVIMAVVIVLVVMVVVRNVEICRRPAKELIMIPDSVELLMLS